MRAYTLLSGRASFELLEGDFVIGRAKTCHLVLDDPSVSREHGPYVEALQARGDALSTVERLQLGRLAGLVA